MKGVSVVFGFVVGYVYNYSIYQYPYSVSSGKVILKTEMVSSSEEIKVVEASLTLLEYTYRPEAVNIYL